MNTIVNIANHKMDNVPTFEQLPMGQWFIDETDNLYCKIARDKAFNPHGSVATFGDEEKVTLVEEIRIEIVK